MIVWIRKQTYLDLLVAQAEGRAKLESTLSRIEYLRQENDALQKVLSREKDRADVAVDRLLEGKGVQAITPPRAPSLEELSSMFEESPEEVREIQEHIRKIGAAEILLETS